jgi:uncharacterized repeat protein (TIGR01451 family)
VSQSQLGVYKNDLNDFAVRPTTMHDSVAGDPMWLVTEHGDGSSIDVIKMTGVLSTSATFTYTNLPVAAYSNVVNPLNPNGSVITNNIDARIEKAAEANNILVATQSVSVSNTEDDAQWYAIDVSSGTPTLKQQGRVSAGNHTYITYPSIDINAAGQIGMTYMKSGTDNSTDYLSMYVTGRNPGDAAGTMQTPVPVPAGAGKANYHDFSGGGRAGDLSGINVDPVDGSFWAANEFANTESTANWGTAVANFTVANPLPSVDLAVSVSGPSSVTAGGSATYTITIANNSTTAAQNVVLSDTLPAGSTFTSIGQTSGSDGFTMAQSGGTVTETAQANIAPNSSDTFSLVVGVPTGLANGASFNDTATVQSANPDSNAGDNTQTVTGSVINTILASDLSVKISGPSSSSEGNTVTYTITVTNAGPSSATGVVLTDTLGAVTSYRSATTSQGTFSAAGGVVTFTLGTIGVAGTATAKVTVQAIEDGSTSNVASVTSGNADSNSSNNSASATTSFAEPTITVSGLITSKSQTLTNAQVAAFSHASGVEPVGSFSATINWGDGATSAGVITLAGTTYQVSGSHTYKNGGNHVISTTVVETGNSPGHEGGSKLDANPGTLPPGDRDIVQLSSVGQGNHNGQGNPGGGLGIDDGVLLATLPGRKKSRSGFDPAFG